MMSLLFRDGTIGTIRRAKNPVPIDAPAARAAIAVTFGVGGKPDVLVDLTAYLKKLTRAGRGRIADIATSAGVDIICWQQVQAVYQKLLAGEIKVT